jgi:hypothetical protein
MKYGSRLRAPKYMTGCKFASFLKNKNQVGVVLGKFQKKPFSLHPVLNGSQQWFPGRAVRHSSAKAATAVRIRWKPQVFLSPSHNMCEGFFFYLQPKKRGVLTQNERVPASFQGSWHSRSTLRRLYLAQIVILLRTSRPFAKPVCCNLTVLGAPRRFIPRHPISRTFIWIK